MNAAPEAARAVGNRCAAVHANADLIVVDTYSAGKLDPQTQSRVHAPTASADELGESVLRALAASRGHQIGPDDAPDLYRGRDEIALAYRNWIDRLLEVGGYPNKRRLFKSMKHCMVTWRSDLAHVEVIPTRHEGLEGWAHLDRTNFVVLPADASKVAVGEALRSALGRCVG